MISLELSFKAACTPVCSEGRSTQKDLEAHVQETVGAPAGVSWDDMGGRRMCRGHVDQSQVPELSALNLQFSIFSGLVQLRE